MTTIRFFIKGYEYVFASVEVENNEFYPIPHVGEDVSDFAEEIIVRYPANHDGAREHKELENINFDYFHVRNVTYSLGGNDAEDSGNLVDISLEGDFYDFE